MPWTRLDPAEIIPHLHFVHGPADQDDAAHAERDMARLRRALLTGAFIAVQNEQGRMFIGTEAEAAEHMRRAAKRP